MKRSTKFYRKNEAEVMESLGLKPTKNSGSGWIEKEDGQNDYVICQLKSTDAQSIKVNQSDIRILEKNATVAHKLPVFAIQFLNTGEVWLMAKPEDFASVAECIETGKVTKQLDFGLMEAAADMVHADAMASPTVRGASLESRCAFFEEQQKRYNKTKSAR